MEYIGHRGCPDHNPENTVRAVQAATERLSAVEIDLRRCGSGELVAFHDARVDAVTDGTGRVADLDLSTLQSFSVNGTDERVATLTEILDAVPETVTLQIELKVPGLIPDLRTRLAERGRTNVRLSSFSAPALAQVHQSDWTPETGLLFGEFPDASLDLATSLDCENVHPHVELCLDTAVVERAQDAGFRVLAWGLSDAAEVPALRDRGVDGVTTDTWEVGPSE